MFYTARSLRKFTGNIFIPYRVKGARHRDAATAKGRRRTCAVVLRSADLPASANSTNFARHSVCGREAERADFEVSPAERPRASRCYMYADDAAPSWLVTMLRNAELGFSSEPTQPTTTATATAKATVEMAGRRSRYFQRNFANNVPACFFNLLNREEKKNLVKIDMYLDDILPVSFHTILRNFIFRRSSLLYSILSSF